MKEKNPGLISLTSIMVMLEVLVMFMLHVACYVNRFRRCFMVCSKATLIRCFTNQRLFIIIFCLHYIFSGFIAHNGPNRTGVLLLPIHVLYFSQMQMTDDMRFYVLFNSISVISGRWFSDNEEFCAVESRLWLERSNGYIQKQNSHSYSTQTPVSTPQVRLEWD